MSNVEQFNLNGITVDVCDANARDMIGDEYDATTTYAVGDYCIYNNTMKKCITAVSTPEAFDSEKWINTTIQEVLKAANTKIGTASLNTSASDLSGAINEHETDIGRIEYDLGSETLPDTTKTVKGNINKINSSLTNYTTYATTADEIVIGKKDGKTLYRKYVSASNLTVATNTEFVIANSVLPNNATNVSISDKSRVYASAIDTSMGANSMYWTVYAVGQSIRGRQGYSSSTSWNVDVWIEYTKG